MISIQEQEKQLNGKRYKIISKSIEKQKSEGKIIPYEMEISLHYAYKLTMEQVRKDFLLGVQT